MSKHQFLLKTLVKYATLQSTGCPYCNCARTTILQWKNRIWQLRRCDECSLNFRYPEGFCRTRRSVAHDGWRCLKMDLPAVAQQSIQRRSRAFQEPQDRGAYDLFGLRPGRANHGDDQAMNRSGLPGHLFFALTASPERCAARHMDQPTI
jgi:hypothetical protein